MNMTTNSRTQIWAEAIDFVRQLVVLIGANYGDVDEIVQEICLKVLQYERKNPGGTSRKSAIGFSRAWLRVIARNAVSDFYRRTKKHRENCCFSLVGDVLSVGEGTEYYLPVAAKEAAEPDLKWAIIDGLNGLSRMHQLTMQLYLQDISYETIAELTQAELGTVRSRIFYCKRKLQKLLADYR